MQETPVQSLGWEDLLEKGKATHSSILAWRIPWDTTEQISLSLDIRKVRKKKNVNFVCNGGLIDVGPKQ